jgi:arylsulfatase A-like enzyme
MTRPRPDAVMGPSATVLGTLVWCWVAMAGCAREPARPNVVLVSIDSLRADHLAAYGYARETSPHIDALAASGALFEHAFSTTSWTLPSHIALFTSMHDLVHGVIFHDRVLDPLRTTLPEVFHQHGYATAGFYSGPYLIPAFGFGRGFDTYVPCMDYLDPGALERTDFVPASHQASHADVTSPCLQDAVVSWLDEAPARPFFLFLHMWDVHYDYIPPPEYARRFTDPDYDSPIDFTGFQRNPAINRQMNPRDLAHLIGLYDGEIAYTDHHLGQIVAHLDALGLRDNTLIVVTSDHGDAFFEHGLKGHQNDLYDEVLRIPLIFSWPGQVRPAQRYAEQVSIIDVMPTVLGLVDLPTPPEALGRDLSPLLRGERSPDAAGSTVFAELTLFGKNYDLNLRALRTPEYKAIVDIPAPGGGSPRSVVYDLGSDPGERRPVGADRPDLARTAARQLNEMMTWSEDYAHRLPRGGGGDGAPDIGPIRDRLRALGYLGER